MATPVAFYHENCIDGLLAIAIWVKHHPASETYPVQYRKMPQLSSDVDEVVFLDFTPPSEWVSSYASQIKKLTIIDHHKTAMHDIKVIKEICESKAIEIQVSFDLTKSGGELTWIYLEDSVYIPPLVKIAAAYDLGHALGEREGFVDIFAHYLEGSDTERFSAFYDYVTESDPVTLEKEYEKCRFVNQQREQKIRWFEQRLKYHQVTLPWAKGSPQVEIAFTHCPHYLITSFAKYIIANNPRINIVLGVSINDNSVGLSFRGRAGEDYARLIAEKKCSGGGHDSAAGGYVSGPQSFVKLANYFGEI